MSFCTQQFLFFFLLAFTAYWALPWRRARVWWLLVLSFYFYASWHYWLAGIVCVTSVLDYVIARGMDAADSPGERKAMLAVSLVMNLGLLAWFKYMNFFLQSLEE